MSSIKKPVTPVVELIGRLSITGNTIPHVWYQRSEFRSDANRPDRNMITIVGDILYWYRPREVRDEDEGGIFLGYERKFARDKLQYNYERRGTVFGMSDREVSDACNRAQKKGLLKIEYRTERIKGKLLHNIVYIELVPEAIAATLAGPNVGPVVKAKGAKRGRHVKAGGTETPEAPTPDEAFAPTDAGVDDEGIDEGEELEAADDQGEAEKGTSLNSGGLTSLNLEDPGTEFRDTYNESSPETSFSREFRGGAFNVTGDPRAHDPQPAAPVAVADQAPHTTTTDASLQKDEAGPDQATPEAPIPSPVIFPEVALHEQQPPDGGAADAADEDLLSPEEFDWLTGRSNDQTTNTEEIPGGAAAGAASAAEAPRGDGAAVRALSVALLAPVGRDELLRRPVAGLESEEFKAIRSLVTGKLIGEGLLDQPTPTGGYSREDWCRLTLAELVQVKLAAQADAQAGVGTMTTLAIDGLDRMIGGGRKVKSKAKAPVTGGQDPADIARHDPQLRAGQRCRVDGQLGVVFEVTNAAYLVDLDDGERLTVDRALARQLQRLVASDAPAPAPRVAAEVITLADVWTRWQPRDGGEVVTVKAVEGANRVLSNNARIAVYLLKSKFVEASA